MAAVQLLFFLLIFTKVAWGDAHFVINGRTYLVRGRQIQYEKDAQGRILRIWSDGRLVYGSAPRPRVVAPPPASTPIPVRKAIPVEPTRPPAVTYITPPAYPQAPVPQPLPQSLREPARSIPPPAPQSVY